MQIAYEIERKDIFAFQIRSTLGNKFLRILYLLIIGFNLFEVFSPLVRRLLQPETLSSYDGQFIFRIFLQGLTVFLSGIILFAGLVIVVSGLFHLLLLLKYKYGDGTIGHHLIALKENCLVEITDVNETQHNWKSVQKIIDTKNYLYIYVSPTNAHVIPKRYFKSDSEAQNFLAEAMRLKENSKTKFASSYLASAV